MRSLESDADVPVEEAVTLLPAECRDVNRWWTIARSVSNVAHDLKNALQVISGNVEMLQLRKDLEAPVEKRLQTIATQAARAVGTMDPLLQYARETSPQAHAVDLQMLAPLALSFRSTSLGRAGVLTSVVSSGTGPLMAAMEPAAALQLLLNLLLRAEGEVVGRPAAKITVAVTRTADVVLLVVDGRAEGDKPENVRESATVRALSERVTSDLAHGCGAVLRVTQDPHGIRLELSVPAESQAAQAADSSPPSR